MGTAIATPNGAGQQLNPQQVNLAARKLVLAQSVTMKQQISSKTYTPSQQSLDTIIPRNVGLILGFVVEVSATATNTSATVAANPTDFGAWNLISNFQYTDLQNNQRHNTYGFHFGLVESVKHRWPWTGAATLSQAAGNFGANWTIDAAPALTVSGGATPSGTVKCSYWVPMAYSHEDLRGAIYANVVANQMALTYQINTAPFSGAGDDTFAVYNGAAGGTATGTLSNVVVTVYQVYLDQLPLGQSGVVVPTLDISSVYQLLYSNFTNIAQGQDFYIQYTNFRRYFGVFIVFNSTGALGGRHAGSDINYWAQVSANFTNIFKNDPYEQARVCRRILQCDPPPGVYYFPTRQKPIYTLTYGNMQLDLNPSSAGAGAYALTLWEFIALQNTLSSAGSLPANG